MANSVADVALLLSVIAGPDGLDPRQIGVRVCNYVEAFGRDARGMKIALVKEGFGRPESEEAVDRTVREAASMLSRAGATVEEVSVPMHTAGYDLGGDHRRGIGGADDQRQRFRYNWDGYYVTSLMDAYARGWRSRRTTWQRR